ncbi:hypothetical protein JCM21900_000457 [Sporobolomyces salmonicolor]
MPYWIVDGMELPSQFCSSTSTRPGRSPLPAPIPVAPPKPLPAVSPSPPLVPNFSSSATPVRHQPALMQDPSNPFDILQHQPQARASPSSAFRISQQFNQSLSASAILEHLASSPAPDGLESVENRRPLAKDESEELISRPGHGRDSWQGEGEAQLAHPYERGLPWLREVKRTDSKGSLVSERLLAGGGGAGGGKGGLASLVSTNPDSYISSFNTATTVSHRSSRSGSPVGSLRRGPLDPHRTSGSGVLRRLGKRSVDSLKA